MSLDQWKKIVEIGASGITVFGVIIAGIFTLIEYSEAVKRHQVRETLRFVDRFNEGPVWTARVALDNFWYDNRSEAKKAARTVDDYREYVVKTVKDCRLESDVRKLIDFFESLQACFDSDVCDQESALTLLGKQAQFHWNRHRFYIEYMRGEPELNDERFGRRLEQFVKLYKIGSG